LELLLKLVENAWFGKQSEHLRDKNTIAKKMR